MHLESNLMRYFYGLGIRLKFITPLKDVTAKERESAEFTVELSHDNIPVIWYKNDQRLHTSKVVSMKDDGKFHTLTFKDLCIDDTSQIRVEAMDKSSEAKLTVLGTCHLTLVCLMDLFRDNFFHIYISLALGRQPICMKQL